MQYWCNDNEEKNLLKQKYIENTKKEQEKYSYDNLFKNKSKIVENISNEQEHKEVIEYKESIFTRIKNWFKRLFNK